MRTTDMTADITEAIPTVWDEEAEAFFYVVADVFDADFLYGASVLLATYDEVATPDLVAA